MMKPPRTVFISGIPLWRAYKANEVTNTQAVTANRI